LQIAMNRGGLDATFHLKFEGIHILIDFQCFHSLFELIDLKLPVKRTLELLYLKIEESSPDLSFLS
jgi:P2-related tail formation protein